MVTSMKQSIVKLKLVRKPQILRNAVMQLGKLSEVMICSKIEDNSLFTRLGKLDGILKIVDHVFENVKKDQGLMRFYENKSLAPLK